MWSSITYAAARNAEVTLKLGNDKKPLYWNTFHDHCRAKNIKYEVVSYDTGTNIEPAWVSSIEGEPKGSKVESKASAAEITLRGLEWIIDPSTPSSPLT
ncbi:hypothetical protein FRB90_002128 [Tulasnella sp. 427]|nr:hypothetical protein FRB90_002128 [Tulasnella sp. 427]